jgi:hypothetical protein
VTHGPELHLPLPQRGPEVCFGRSQEQRPGIAPTSYSRSCRAPERRLLTQPDCSLSIFIAARVRIKADATIQATIGTYTDGPKICFEWTIPMRAIILKASAILTFSFFGHVRPLWRCILIGGNVRSQQLSLISQGAVCYEAGCGRMLMRLFDRTRFWVR